MLVSVVNLAVVVHAVVVVGAMVSSQRIVRARGGCRTRVADGAANLSHFLINILELISVFDRSSLLCSLRGTAAIFYSSSAVY